MSDGEVVAECVINVSEGRDPVVIGAIAEVGGPPLLDVHSDPEHHRSVLTLGGPLEAVEEAARHIVEAAVARIDLHAHAGIHPRLGAVDVVPFVPLSDQVQRNSGSALSAPPSLTAVIEARNRLAQWAGTHLALPCFLYGPERSLPDVRRLAFRSLDPDFGPLRPHPTAGATAVGARSVLVAYNVWIGPQDDGAGRDGGDGQAQALAVACSLADQLRGPAVRSLGFSVETGAQVSVNLLDPLAVSPADIYDLVAREVAPRGCSVLRAELVGLIPAAVLDGIPRHRWPELDLAAERTIESRMEARRSAPDSS